MRILYDVYDNLDGVTQGNRPEVVLQILQSIFERNLYFWPTHELHNQIEFIFTGSVGMVLSAQWQIHPDFLNTVTDERGRVKKAASRVDVTGEIQEAFTNYYSVFGTKNIEFDLARTPYKTLSDLVGDAKSNEIMKSVKRNSNSTS